MMNAIDEGASCIHIVCDDTDVFCLELHVLYPFNQDVSVLMVSPKSQNHLQIDIMKTGKTHFDIIPNLLAMHSLSGCDTVPQLYNMGKKTFLKHIKKSTRGLPNLGNEDTDIIDVVDESIFLVAACYGSQSDSSTPSLSELRYIFMIFQRITITRYKSERTYK